MKFNDYNYFGSLKRIASLPQKREVNSQYLLLPEEVSISYFPEDGTVLTSGLGKLDKRKDFIEVVEINDPINCQYTSTGVFSSRPYIESLDPIQHHVTVQGIILSKPDKNTKEVIGDLSTNYPYGKTAYDKIWVSSKPIESLQDEDVVIIMNRRIGGWDGSIERPVIELLGAGGHVASVWESGSFKSHSPDQTIEKEVREEIGLAPSQYRANKLGGFFNRVTGELVILYGIWIPFNYINKVQESAFGNIEENIDGIYLGTFEDIMENYLADASSFAGGEKSKSTNFPSNATLMNKIKKELKESTEK